MLETLKNHVLPAGALGCRAVELWQEISGERLEPGRVETLKLKKKSAVYRLEGAGPKGAAIIAKRCVAVTGLVERLVYQEVLAHVSSVPLRCLGFTLEPEGEFCWLFLENAGGEEYSPGCAEHRALAGRWLASVHAATFEDELGPVLPDRGPSHYFQSLRSSRAKLSEWAGSSCLSADEGELLRTLGAQYDLIETRWDELKSFCDGWPRSLVHGDLVAKNLRIRNGVADPALLVFDWELAGWGIPATDLAQALGQCVSPDLKAYRAALKQSDRKIAARDLQQLAKAKYGNVLRLVDKIFWMAQSMVHASHEFLSKPLRAIETYQLQLSVALRALEWSWHD